MKTTEEVKVIDEEENHYLIQKNDGKQMKLFKINIDDIKKFNHESNQKVAKNIHPSTFKILISQLEFIINTTGADSCYKTLAEDLTKQLNLCYNEVGTGNLFHHPIKNIDPAIYGKGFTLVQETRNLYDMMLQVAELMLKEGTIDLLNPNVSSYDLHRIMIQKDNKDFEEEMQQLVQKYRKKNQIIFHQINTNEYVSSGIA